MALTVEPADRARDVRRFIDAPWQLIDRAAFPVWVPPLRLAVKDALDTKHNPFYRHAVRQLFLAYDRGRLVGRIAAIENRAHNEFHQDNVGFFGFFDCVDDADVARALFSRAEAWLAERGLTVMRGPVSPSTNHECGLLVDGFDQHPMIMTTWNPPYYPALLDAAGFTKAKDLLALWLSFQGPDAFDASDRYARHAARAIEGGNVTFRDLDLKHFKREVELCWDIYNAAWEKNWGFVPMTKAEFVHEAQVLKYAVYQRFSFIVEVDGDPAGALVVLPDYHIAFKEIGNGRLLPTGIFKILRQRRSVARSGRALIFGVKEKYRSRSVYALIMNEVLRRARAISAIGAEGSWILEDNGAMIRPLERLGARVYRRWRIYDRPVTNG